MLKGVATYPKGDMVQGRYFMALTDLGSKVYYAAVSEESPAFKVGKSEKSENAVASTLPLLARDGLLD